MILPAVNIDSAKAQSSYFLPYQLAWIHDTSRMMLAEKSVRIGWTYCDAFRNVTRRIQRANRDYLFQTKDQASSVEYLKTCMKFVGIFNLTKSVLSHGEETIKVPSIGADGKPYQEEVKFGVIKFDNGSRIIAFSSNPYAMAVFEGDVGLDEFAKHQNAEKLWETAQGRITWGYDLGAWSAHDGTDTLFYQFSREAAQGKGGWSHYRVTMEDAVASGIVEKVNASRGTNFTREQFIADAKTRARLPEIYEQSYNCNPMGSTSSIVGWNALVACQRKYSPPRAHFEARQIVEMFGAYRKEEAKSRSAKIVAHIKSTFAELFTDARHHALGFDVAASGDGDMACIYTDVKRGDERVLSGLFTCRTDDWDFLQTVLYCFLRETPSVYGCGDETGLGRQICWNAAQEFRGKFEGVNFSSKKHEMGALLMGQLASSEKIIPTDGTGAGDIYGDIAQDYFAMRKITQGGRLVFTEGKNVLNPNSHCDIAWAGALASEAATRRGSGDLSASSTNSGGGMRSDFGGRGERLISGGRAMGL